MSTLSTTDQHKILTKILAEASTLKSTIERVKKAISYTNYASAGAILDSAITLCDDCSNDVYSIFRINNTLTKLDTAALMSQHAVKMTVHTTSVIDILSSIRLSNTTLVSLWTALVDGGITGNLLTLANNRITKHNKVINDIKTLLNLPGVIS
jgi:hypothetical protein